VFLVEDFVDSSRVDVGSCSASNSYIITTKQCYLKQGVVCPAAYFVCYKYVIQIINNLITHASDMKALTAPFLCRQREDEVEPQHLESILAQNCHEVSQPITSTFVFFACFFFLNRRAD
jgi:hypothetical protein